MSCRHGHRDAEADRLRDDAESACRAWLEAERHNRVYHRAVLVARRAYYVAELAVAVHAESDNRVQEYIDLIAEMDAELAK